MKSGSRQLLLQSRLHCVCDCCAALALSNHAPLFGALQLLRCYGACQSPREAPIGAPHFPAWYGTVWTFMVSKKLSVRAPGKTRTAEAKKSGT